MSTESTATEGTVERRIPTAMLAWDVHHVAGELGHPPRLYEYDAQGEFSSATVRDRFGTWLAALRAAGVEPDPDQHITESTGSQYGLFQAVRRAYNELGRPPSRREAADARRVVSTVKTVSCWDDLLRAAGVPGRADVVAEAVADRLDDRHPWQDSVEFRAPDLEAATGMGAPAIGNVLRDIAGGKRTPDAADGFVLNGLRRSRRTTWQVRETEPVTDGGTSLDDAETVAWCSDCKRFVTAEDEAAHARTQHLLSARRDVESRYRRISREYVRGVGR